MAKSDQPESQHGEACQGAISGLFKLAKREGFFDGENPVRDTEIDPKAAPPAETHAYTLEEIQAILDLLPEPAATIFSIAAFAGLRRGEIAALRWEDYRDGQLFVSRSLWRNHLNPPKTAKGCAPVPVIRQVAERLEIHRMSSENNRVGPVFRNRRGNPLVMDTVENRMVRPALNRCVTCGKPEGGHAKADHLWQRDDSIPAWYGWHAARRGLGSNLYRLGVKSKIIQAILRHADVSITEDYYIKTADDDVRSAMTTLEAAASEKSLRDTYRTLDPRPSVPASTVQ